MIVDITRFWQEVEGDSNVYEQAVHYPGYFETPFCTMEEIKQLIRNWCTSDLEYVKGTSRIYINGGMSYAHSKLFYNNPPREEDSLEAYHQSIFGDQRAGVFLDQIERYHEGIAQKAAEFVQPLIDRLGFPHFTCTLSLLMGNYGETPFGVHYDFLGGRTVHLILEGQKEMQSWQREEVHRITGEKSRNFYWKKKEKLMESGKKYSLSPGDFLLLPINTYHIGNSSTFNVDLCITVVNEDNQKVVQKSLRRYALQLNDVFSGATFDNDFNQHQLTIPNEDINISLKDIIEDYSLRLQSNGGLKFAPQLIENVENLDGQKLGLKAPFQLAYSINGEDLNLYTRGRVIRLYHEPSLIQLIEKWNENRYLEYSDIITFLETDIDKEEIDSLLDLLYKYNGIEIVN